MRIAGSKEIEGVLKNAYNLTHIGKAIHRLNNVDRRNAQVRWIEKLKIDFIGRFETLDEDFASLTGQLDLPGAELGKLNVSRRKPITDYFCGESKRIVEDLYYHDFAYFGYEYEADETFGIGGAH